ADYFVRNDLRGVHDEVHPQWNGRRIDVYFVENAEAEADGRPLVELGGSSRRLNQPAIDQTATPERTLLQRVADAALGLFNQQPSPKGPRGQIQIFPDRRMSISLLEGADRSTFIHESGHFFLEVYRDIAADPD